MAFISRFDNRKPKQPDDLVNERVRFKEVLVIDQNGDQLGVKSSREALDIAYDANLDLVCVAPNAKPPVCRIMDFGKYRFEQQKKAREMKKNSKVVTLKEKAVKAIFKDGILKEHARSVHQRTWHPGLYRQLPGHRHRLQARHQVS